MPTGVYTRTKEMLTGKHTLGRIESAETRRKKSESHKGEKNYIFGKKMPEEIRKKISESRRGKLCGILHHMWKGGHSRGYKTGYYSSEYKDWRRKVFDRDSYKCQVCGIIGTYLTAHHIKSWAKYPEFRFDIDNGVTLCEDCHSKTDNYKGRNKNAHSKTKGMA